MSALTGSQDRNTCTRLGSIRLSACVVKERTRSEASLIIALCFVTVAQAEAYATEVQLRRPEAGGTKGRMQRQKERTRMRGKFNGAWRFGAFARNPQVAEFLTGINA
jgi:hypothetical protein